MTLDDLGIDIHFVKEGVARSKPLQLWFLKACHLATGCEMIEADQLLSLPSSFPFKFTIAKADIRRSTEFEVHRQGHDLDLVSVASAPRRLEHTAAT